MNKSRVVSVLMITILMVSLFTGCSSTVNEETTTEQKETDEPKNNNDNKENDKEKEMEEKEEVVKTKNETIDQDFFFQVFDKADTITAYKSHTELLMKSGSEEKVHKIDIAFEGKSAMPSDVESCVIKSEGAGTNDDTVARTHQEYTRVSDTEVLLKEFDENGEVIKDESAKGLNFTPNYYGQLESLLMIAPELEARTRDGNIALIFKEGGSLKKEDLFEAIKYDYNLQLSGDDIENIDTEFVVVIDIESKTIEQVVLTMKYSEDMEFIAITDYFDIK